MKPGSPKKKQAALIAEKAMKSHIAKKNDKKKARSSWMVPIAITVAVVAFWLRCSSAESGAKS